MQHYYHSNHRIGNTTYDLSHLDPMDFTVRDGIKEIKVLVLFSCHCFTEGWKQGNEPARRYVWNEQVRTFDDERYNLSKLLPDAFRKLGTSTVYASQQQNFFFIRQNPLVGLAGPYLVFFRPGKATEGDRDVIINVESAYMKPGIVQRAEAIRFTTLIASAAAGRKPPKGTFVTIKRK